MSNRKDWSWKPDAATRKALDDGNIKIRAAQKRKSDENAKPKAAKS